MKSPHRTLVVDADIASAAGPDPKEHPWPGVAKDCHDVLNAIWKSRGFSIVFDPTLLREWKQHHGRTGEAWLARMLSGGRVQLVEANTQWIIDLIRELPVHDRPTAAKDSHLVALAHDPGDKRILSNDTKAREKFCRIPAPNVRQIHWVSASPDAAQWLKNGAQDWADVTLGA